MLRTRLVVIIASIGIAGAAMLSGSLPVGAQAALSIVVTPNSVAPGGQISYAISNAACVPAGTGAAVFQWSINDSGGVPVSGPFFQLNDPFVGGAFTRAPFPAPATPGTYTMRIDGVNACQGSNALTTFIVQAPATTAPPTTAPPTTVAPTTTAAAAVPPASLPATPTTTAAAPAALPATGQDLNLAVVALLLLLGGGGLVAATRRR